MKHSETKISASRMFPTDWGKRRWGKLEDIFHILQKHSFACSAINLLYLSHDVLNNRAASGASGARAASGVARKGN